MVEVLRLRPSVQVRRLVTEFTVCRDLWAARAGSLEPHTAADGFANAVLDPVICKPVALKCGGLPVDLYRYQVHRELDARRAH
jgi:hypothetical protein